jgi:hypothetical protein
LDDAGATDADVAGAELQSNLRVALIDGIERVVEV